VQLKKKEVGGKEFKKEEVGGCFLDGFYRCTWAVFFFLVPLEKKRQTPGTSYVGLSSVVYSLIAFWAFLSRGG
jgi:hypothetical protein